LVYKTLSIEVNASLGTTTTSICEFFVHFVFSWCEQFQLAV